MISDAVFAAALRNPQLELIVLYEQEFAYEAAGAPAVGTHYLASAEFRTGPTDTPPNRTYRGSIEAMPGLEVSIDAKTLGGRSRLSTGGQFRLANGDGSVDYLLDSIIDGREGRIYVGFRGWSRADFRLVGVVVAERARSEGEMFLIIEVKDKRLLLDAAVAGPVVAGTGPDTGKFTTLVFGSVRNVDLLVKDAATLTYHVVGNFKSTSVLDQVREGGLSLSSGVIFSADNTALTANTGTDTLTRAAHGLAVDDVIVFTGTDIFAGLALNTQYWVIAAGLTANDWRVSLTRGGAAVNITFAAFLGTVSVTRRRYYDQVAIDGTVQLVSTPTRRLTADVGDTATADVGAAVRALVLTYGNLPAGSIDESEFTNLTAAVVAKGSAYAPAILGLAVYDRANLVDLLDWLAASFCFWYGFDHAGVLRLGLIDPMTIASAPIDYEVGAIDGELEVENLAPTVANATLGIVRNWAVQPDGLLDSVTPAQRALYSKQHQEQAGSTAASGTSYATNWQLFHKTAVTGPLEDTLVTRPFGFFVLLGTALSDAHLADKRPHLRIARIRIGLEAYSWRLGQVVNLTRPRHGFAAGRRTRVLGKRIDWLARVVDLTLIARVAPDTTTSDH